MAKRETAERNYFVGRHSIKPSEKDPESKQYRGISEKGVLVARESAHGILQDMEKSAPGTVMYLGGASDAVRTKSTAQVYGDELKKLVRGRDNYLVITKDDVSKRHMGYSEIVRELKRIVEQNPDKKIIIDLPLGLNQLSIIKGRWFTPDGKPTEYTAKLIAKHGNNHNESMKEWIASQGSPVDGVTGPSPVDVAREYQKGLGRLEKFSSKFIGKNRPHKTGLVGHSYDADVFLTYLAGEGKVDLPTFERVSSGKGMIKESEMASVRIRPNNRATISYRGKDSIVNLENIAAAVMILSFAISVLFFSKLTANVIGVKNTSSSYGFGLFILSLISAFSLIYLKNRKNKKNFEFY